MKKENCKLFVFLFVLFTFLFNLDGVKAVENCSCYYQGVGTSDDNGDAYQTIYLAQIDFNKTEYENIDQYYNPKIAFFGEKGHNTVTGESGKIEDKTSEVSWLGVAFSEQFSDLYNTVAPVFDNCGVESCGNIRTKRYLGPFETADTGGLKFYSSSDSKQLLYEDLPFGTVGGVLYNLNSISKEEFDKLKSSENVSDTSEDMGLSGFSGIIKWGNLISGTGYYNISDVGNACNSVAPIADYLSKLLWLICVVAIIGLVVMTAINFIQAIVGSEEDKLLKAFKNLKTRIIVLFILILLPTIVGFVVNIYNSNVDNSNGVVKIGEDNKPFCDVTN